jgi:hypothetical protein
LLGLLTNIVLVGLTGAPLLPAFYRTHSFMCFSPTSRAYLQHAPHCAQLAVRGCTSVQHRNSYGVRLFFFPEFNYC